MRANSFGMAVLGAAGVLWASSASAAFVTTIDTFDVGPQVLTVSQGAPIDTDIASGLAATDVIGNEREVGVEYLSGPPSGVLDATVAVDGGLATFVLSNDTGVNSTAVVIWDDSDGVFGNDFNPGLPDVDLTAGGADGIALDIVETDLDSNITISIYDDSGNFVTLTQTIAAGTTGNVLFAFDDFTPSGAFDPLDVITSANSIVLTLGATRSLDIRIDLIGTFDVPEPLALGVFGLGLAGLGFFSRRKRAA